MPYDFFFSYRRADFGAPMREFFTDLAEDVRKLRGLNKNENMAFFDQEEIETGDNWDAALLDALQQSRVIVPLYSPAYFKSEYCGKEWQNFHLRRQAYAEQHGGVEPPVIKPVVWIPIRKDNKLTLPDNVSEAVKRVQYTWKEEDSAINQQGLEQMVRLKASNTKLYWDFVRGFAEEIKDAIEQIGLPPLANVPALEHIPSAFSVATPLAPAAAVAARPGFRRHVRFIFAALDPVHLGGGRDPAPYQDLGGPDWKPFYPDLHRRIGALAAHIVSDADLDFDSDQIEMTDDLAGAVRAALEDGKPVVVFVDRWSLYASQDYQDIFREFDGRNFNNCAVLLPWNPGDPELAANRQNIDPVIADVLHFRSQYAPTSPYYCKDVDSVDNLNQTLHAVLNQIQAEMRRNAPVRRAVGSGIARPLINGPGRISP
jgi:FxsC-like protein